MENKYILLIAGTIGIFLGIASTTFLLVGSFLSLIPWAIAAVVIGYYVTIRKIALLAGSIYGFSLVVSFLISGDKNFHLIYTIFILTFGIIGAICGLVLSYLGNILHTYGTKYT